MADGTDHSAGSGRAWRVPWHRVVGWVTGSLAWRWAWPVFYVLLVEWLAFIGALPDLWVVILLMASLVWITLQSGSEYWRVVAFWSTPRARPVVLVVDALVVLALLTALMAALMAVFNVEVTPGVGAEQRFSTMQAACLWNLLDAIPSLKVPETLNWDLSHPVTGHGGGSLLLVYKALAVFPTIGLIVGFVEARRKAAARG